MTDSAADRLRQDRASVASGKLTLDREQARRKMRLFRLPTPYMYVLQFVRAASVLGAGAISFDIRAMTMTCTFDATFDRELLEDIWSPMFDERTTVAHQATRNLALGVASAQALNPLQIEVCSGSTRLVLYEDHQEIEDQDPRRLTTIRVDEKFRFGHVLDFFESLVDVLPEAFELRQHCANSIMCVSVNGVIASHQFEDADTLAAQTTRGEARVRVFPALGETTLALLRDDVQIAVLSRPPHIVGIRAAINSRTVATDLSGRRLQEAPDAEWDALTAVIHSAIDGWLRANTEKVSHDEVREELERIASFIVQRSDPELAPETRRFVEWLVAQPIFRSAIVGTTHWVTLSQPPEGEAVPYSTERVVLPGGPRDVLYLRPNSPVKRLLDRARIPTVDWTDELVDRAIRHKNRARWRDRVIVTSHEFEEYADRRVVEVDGLRGSVRATRKTQGLGSLVLERRLLWRGRSPLPFDFVVTGDLQANARFDGVVRDDRFDDIALALLAATQELFGELVPARQMEVLERIVVGVFETDVLGALGYPPDEAWQLLGERQAHVRENDPLGLTIAGRLATEPHFDGYSLIEIVQAEHPPMFSQAYEMQRIAARLVLDLTPRQKQIVKRVRPDAGEARDILQQEEAYQAFQERGPYVEDPDLRPIWRHAVSEPMFDIELALLGDDAEKPHGVAEVVFVLQDRVLFSETMIAAFGNWLVIVRSDRLTPNHSYNGVVADETYHAALQSFRRHLQQALRDWFANEVERGVVEIGGVRLFVRLMLRCADPVRQFPISRFDGSEWTRGLATIAELSAAADRGGGWLQWTAPGQPFMGLFVPGDVVLEVHPATLQEAGVLCDVKFAQAGGNTVSAARREYASRAGYRSSLDGALLTWIGPVEGFDVHIGLYEGEPGIHVELLWLNRVLEHVVVDGCGRFVVVVSGPEIAANEKITGVGAGRVEALATIHVAIGRLIEDACRLLAARGREQLPPSLHRLQHTLLDIAARTPPDASWRDTLMAAPLVESAAGRVSLHDHHSAPVTQRDLLARVENQLEVARGDRRDLLADFTLASLRWSDEGQEQLCVSDAHGVFVRREHPLSALAASCGEVGAAFLASCVYTQINAYYAEITDTDELTLQHRLLEVPL